LKSNTCLTARLNLSHDAADYHCRITVNADLNILVGQGGINRAGRCLDEFSFLRFITHFAALICAREVIRNDWIKGCFVSTLVRTKPIVLQPS
jgi:hypothetical protein